MSVIPSKLIAFFVPILFITSNTSLALTCIGLLQIYSYSPNSSLKCYLIHWAFIWSIITLSLIYSTCSHSIWPSLAYFHWLIFATGPFYVFRIVDFCLYLAKVWIHLCQFLGSSYISGFFILLLKYSFANLYNAF